MPESRIRRKRPYTPPPAKVARASATSGRWVAPAMVTLFVLGLAWVVVFYVTQQSYPIPGIHLWNMVIGFAFIGGGFVLATRWK